MNESNEVDRLCRALKRDLSSVVMYVAGFLDDDKPWRRFVKNWDRLCELDLDVASQLHHGIDEISMVMGRIGKPSSPSDHFLGVVVRPTGGLYDMPRGGAYGSTAWMDDSPDGN